MRDGVCIRHPEYDIGLPKVNIFRQNGVNTVGTGDIKFRHSENMTDYSDLTYSNKRSEPSADGIIKIIRSRFSGNSLFFLLMKDYPYP